MKKTIKRSLCLSLLVATSAHAEIITDGTVGAHTNLSGQMTIPQSLGTTAGTNLFHSFKTFNIQTGESAIFTGSDSLKNVISRVTGGQLSTLNGLLKSEIPNANFYFINPAGVTFGANAHIDVPAAFHVSTADSLKFADGNEFSATHPTASTLSIATPESFGFLGNANASIAISGAQLAVKTGQSLDLVAGTIAINQAQIKAEAGNIRLSAIGKNDTDVPLNSMAEVAKGTMTIENGTLEVSGNGSGKVEIQGGDVSIISGSKLFANNTGSQNAGLEKGITILAENLTLDNSQIGVEASKKSGDAGAILIQSDSLNLFNNSVISSDTYGAGHAGNITIQSKDIRINNSSIYSDTHSKSTGNAGNIAITSDSLQMLSLGVISSDTWSSGNAGTISMATENLGLQHVSVIGSDTWASGNAGSIMIQANETNLNFGLIYSDANAGSSGNAGTVLFSGNQLNMLNRATISSNTYAKGNAGSVAVNVNEIVIDKQQNTKPTGIFSNAEERATGNAGEVSIKADSLSLFNGGSIGSETWKSGNAGNLNIAAQQILLDSQSSFETTAQPSATGHAGIISINSDTLTLQNGAVIRSDTYGQGNAGHIIVNNSGKLLINRENSLIDTGMATDAYQGTKTGGNAGNISINTGELEILHGGEISSNTDTKGNAGNVTINAQSMLIDGQGWQSYTSISTDATSYSTGNAGVVNVSSPSLRIVNGGTISSSTHGHAYGNAGVVNVTASNLTIDGQGNPAYTGIFSDSYANLNKNGVNLNHGNADQVSVTADFLNLVNNGKISSSTWSDGQGGDVLIKAHQWLNLDNAAITTTARHTQAGDIHIQGGDIMLKNGQITTSVAEALGNGGNIDVTADSLIMNTGVIQANAVGGSGGNITLNLQALIASENQLIKGGTRVVWQPFISGFNVIQAASETGVSGVINVTSPQFDISGSLKGLDSARLMMPSLDYNLCQGSTVTASSLLQGGKGGVPNDESKAGFIPSATQLPDAPLNFEFDFLNRKPLAPDTVKPKNDYPCAVLPTN